MAITIIGSFLTLGNSSCQRQIFDDEIIPEECKYIKKSNLKIRKTKKFTNYFFNGYQDYIKSQVSLEYLDSVPFIRSPIKVDYYLSNMSESVLVIDTVKNRSTSSFTVIPTALPAQLSFILRDRSDIIQNYNYKPNSKFKNYYDTIGGALPVNIGIGKTYVGNLRIEANALKLAKFADTCEFAVFHNVGFHMPQWNIQFKKPLILTSGSSMFYWNSTEAYRSGEEFAKKVIFNFRGVKLQTIIFV